jgi:hypothetical protein
MNKTLSLDEKVIKKGLERAEQLSMTFSGYITYLINRDTGEIAVTTEQKNK